MKKLLLSIIMYISTITYGQEMDCKKFKNGKFKIIDSEVGNSIIDRKGSKQIEYGEGSKLKLEFKVKWLDDCSYTLELEKVIENPKNIKLPEGMILTTKILEITENSYIQKTSSNFSDMVIKKELFAID